MSRRQVILQLKLEACFLPRLLESYIQSKNPDYLLEMGNIDRSSSQSHGDSDRLSELTQDLASNTKFSNGTKSSTEKRKIARALNGNTHRAEIDSSISSETSDQRPISIESQPDNDIFLPKSSSNQLKAFGEGYGNFQKIVDDSKFTNPRNEKQTSKVNRYLTPFEILPEEY